MVDMNDKEYYESKKLAGENLFLSAKVGLLKAKDLLTMMNIDEAQLKGDTEKVDANIKEYKESTELAKQDVIDAIQERDNFYLANENDITFLDKMAGGLVESVTNPFELTAQIGVAVGTGGLSIPLQLGTQAGLDVAQATLETTRYEDRLPTTGELATTVAMSVAPDLLSMGIGNYIRKAKSGIANSSTLGDININIRNKIDAYDSIMKDVNSKPQQMYTDYGIGDGSVYNVNKRNPFDNFITEIGNEAIVSPNQLKFYSDISKPKPTNNTILGRYVTSIDGVKNIYDKVLNDAKFIRGDEFELNKSYYNPKKTKIQNLSNINKKLNPVIDDIIDGTLPTINDYVARWEVNANKTPSGERVKSPTINYSQIDTTLNAIDAKYNTQRMYAQNEYIQKLGVTPEEYIDKIGKDNRDIVVNWINNEFDSSKDGYLFLKSAYDDSVQLDELKMGVSLYDISDYENFHKKYGRSFDDDQNIVYDDILLDTIKSTKGKPNDLRILQEAMYSNPDEYTKFMVNAKENIGNIKGTGKKYVTDFINTEYDKLTSGIVVDSDNYGEWMKAVSDTMAKTRKDLAEESIKINQTVNKQNMLGDFDKYYTDKITKDNVDKVKLSTDGEVRFNDEIMPLYNSGILQTPIDGNYEKHFANLISDLKKTRSSARWTGEYKSIGELRGYFGEGQMSNFFSNSFGGESSGKYLKTNAELIRDIFDRQTGDIARFVEFGSTSPFVLKNRINFELKKTASNKIGKELSDAQKVAYQTIIDRANNMLVNTQTGATRLIPTYGEELLGKTRNVLRRGILAGTGTSELFVQNYAIASMRAQKYGGAKVYINNPIYQVKRMIKGSKSDLPNARYNIAQIRKDTDLSYLQNDTILKKVDTFAMGIQDFSAKQMSRYGEAHTTSILHNLPDNYNAMENELKDLLRKNGIEESNYSTFKKFTKEHIDNNDLTVDMNLLSTSSEMGNDMAYNLLNTYYQLSDDIGNPMSKSKMHSKVVGELEQWYGMFKSFSRNINTDTIGRVMNYTDAQGISKSRLNLSQYKADLGFRGIAKETALFGTGLTSLAIGGYTYSQIKELTQSDRSLDQKLAIVQIKHREIVDAIKENQSDIIPLMVQYSSINPLEMVETANIPKSLWNSTTKIYETLTDEQKKAYGGTNITEGTTMLVNDILRYTVSRVGVNFAKSTYKTVSDDNIDTLEKVYGLTTEQQKEYESIVRNMSYEDFNVGIMEDRVKIKAEIDMLEGNTESYDKLDTQVKNLFEQSMVDNNIKDSDKMGLRTEFAVISKASKDVNDMMDAVQISTGVNMRPTKAIIETKEFEPTNEFESLPRKKRNYFYYIMAYKGIQNPTEEDYNLYVNNFKNATGDEVTKVLKSVYDINRSEFVETFKSDDMRKSALKIYK
ncbi:MAG: hypothetical protein ACRCX2_14885 [Paraclostridium sp.]